MNKKIVSFAKSRNSANIVRSNMIGVINDQRGSYIKSSGYKQDITKDFIERTFKMGIKDPFTINTIAFEQTKKDLSTKVLIRKQRATSSLKEK